MRPATGLLALALLLFGLGSAQGWSLLHTLAYSLFLTVGLAYCWSWGSVRGIYVRGRPARLRTQVGGYLDERAEVENLTWLPRPWLELIDAGNHPDHNLSQVLALGPQDRRARRVRTPCRQRGHFTLGPLSVASGDPFGLFRRERQVCLATDLVVFPATVDLPSFGRLPGELLGGSVRGERVHFTTPNVATLRDYQPGDSFNRIHWASTARLGKLVVKEFERDPFSDVWIVLDLDRLVQVGSGPDSTEEWGVTAAASLARHFILGDRAVGVATQSGALPVDRGPRQLLRILELLAVARAVRGQPLEELLLAEARRFGRRDSLVVITPTTDARWVAVCRDLAGRGVQASVVLLEAASFGPAPAGEAVRAAVDECGLSHYAVRHGADLAVALAQPSIVRA